jgi:hypothetical protein
VEIELREHTEEEVSLLRNVNQKLQREIQDNAIKYAQKLNSIWLLLEELKAEVPLGGSEALCQFPSPNLDVRKF